MVRATGIEWQGEVLAKFLPSSRSSSFHGINAGNLSVIIPIEKTVTVVWMESPMGEFPSPNTSSTDFP